MTIHKQHGAVFLPSGGNEDSQEVEKDLLGNPSFGFFFLKGCPKTLPAHWSEGPWCRGRSAVVEYTALQQRNRQTLSPAAVCGFWWSKHAWLLSCCCFFFFFGLWTDAEATFISIKNSARRCKQSRVHGVQVLFHLLKPFSQGFFCHHCPLPAKCLPHPFRYFWASFEKHLHPVLARPIVPEDGLRPRSIEDGLLNIFDVVFGPNKALMRQLSQQLHQLFLLILR